MKMRKNIYLLWAFVAMAFLLFSATIRVSDYFELSKNLDIFSSVVKELNNYYVDPIKPGELIKNGIDGMLEKLDPYTVYIPEAEIEDYQIMTTGQYGGIGAVIQPRDEYIMIAQPYENSPAAKAGLMAGDIIIEANGISTRGKKVDEVRNILMGQPGTKVSLKIKRPFREEVMQVDVTREEVKIKDVPYYGVIGKDIGYIKLNSFTESASKEVKEAFLELKEKNAIRSLILDLRNNGGGLMREAVAIVNFFIDRGKLVVSTKGKLEEWDKEHKTFTNPIDKEIPLVILINENSASASEIVAGALQDYDRAVLIGRNTFGKGLVQNIVPLSYNSKMKVTVAKYYIPSGRCIQKIDYSHKNDKGEAEQVPDSLKKPFKTLISKRTVYDGDGITPDILMEDNSSIPLLGALVENNIIFDFATQYRAEHSTPPSIDEFSIDPATYEKFKSFARSKNIQYKTNTSQALQKLKEYAKEENYLGLLSTDFDSMEKHLKPDPDKDMERNKKEISLILGMEIISRYYYQKGEIRYFLNKDPYIDSAVAILRSPDRYTSILMPDASGR